jgi:ADP-ribosylglycohydrolase
VERFLNDTETIGKRFLDCDGRHRGKGIYLSQSSQIEQEDAMANTTIQDRAAGAIMGAFIGDALGLGPHWYYSLDELRRDYGEWITTYTDPKPGRYHAGLKAGQLSQAGFILTLMVRSLVERGGYDGADFCRRMDEELFPLLDGTPVKGPGGYTSQSIRDAWRRRVQQKLPWGQTGGHADTTEAIERTLALAVRYASHPGRLAAAVADNTVLTQTDDTIVSMTVAYCSVLGLLVQGNRFDAKISGKLMALVNSGELPFHTVTRADLQPPQPGDPDPPRPGRFASPDALLTPSYMARAAADPAIRIEPAWKVSIVYGMPCAIYHMLPTSYYLAARFRDDFESAVLHSVNGGGQNQARTILVGALVGAQVGLSGIPRRFIDGLQDSAMLGELAARLATQVEGPGDAPA